MFTLVTDKSKYYRVKRGQSERDVQNVFKAPVCGKVFEGAIIRIMQENFTEYSAVPGDSYKSIAQKFGVQEEELKKLNSGKPVYPTCKLFVPR